MHLLHKERGKGLPGSLGAPLIPDSSLCIPAPTLITWRIILTLCFLLQTHSNMHAKQTNEQMKTTPSIPDPPLLLPLGKEKKTNNMWQMLVMLLSAWVKTLRWHGNNHDQKEIKSQNNWAGRRSLKIFLMYWNPLKSSPSIMNFIVLKEVWDSHKKKKSRGSGNYYSKFK